MDKPPFGEKDVERVRGAVRDQISRVVKMSRAVKMEPDLSSVWDGEEFQSLPPDAQTEVRAWAVKEGYAKAEPAPAATEAPEKKEDPRTENVRGQIGRVAKMAKSMRMEPDLTPVWDSEDFLALSPELQASVRAWAAGQGYGEAKPAVMETEAAEPVSEREPASQEKRERREGPKRKFMNYRVEQELEGGFAVHEDYQEWDDDEKTYKTKTVKTAIAFTGPLAEKLATDPDVAATVAGFASQVRGELDADGVKIFIDRPKNDRDRIYPKWKYTLDGKTVQEQIKLDEIPAELIALIREDKEYFRSPAWKKWFGKQMQRKREDVISAELAKLFPETAPKPAAEAVTEAPKAEAPATAPETPAQPSVPEEAKPEPKVEAKAETKEEEAVMTPELAAGIEMLVDKFAPLFELPKDASKLFDYVTQFSKGIVEMQIYKGGVKKRALPPETLKNAVRAALLEKYRDDGATVAEIKKLMPDARAAEKAADDDVIEVQDEWIEKDEPEKKETPADGTYRALRHDLDAIGDPQELEQFVFSLRELKKSGLDTVASGADRLLSDIEFGKAGALSETRLTGLQRSAREKDFFRQHPALDRRNVQRLEDGRVVAHIDREKPTEAVSRLLRSAVDDALESKGLAGDEVIAMKIADYLLGIVTGRNPNEQVIARFTRDLAAFDERNEELTIKNIDKLGGVIANLAKEITAKRKK